VDNLNNKETLIQNNSRLNTNNIDLSSILNTINKLPTSGEVKVKEHYLDGTNLVIELSNNQTLIIDISEYINNENKIETVAQIEQLIVSYLENKTVKEVEGQ
jgi:hypothetical protein